MDEGAVRVRSLAENALFLQGVFYYIFKALTEM